MKDPGAGIELAQRLCGSFGLSALQRQAEACLVQLRHPEATEVALLGPFGAGKRSFLNFALGRALLPVETLPATGLSLQLRFGGRDRILVSGGTVERPMEHLGSLIEAHEGDARIIVETPAMARWRGLHFLLRFGAWNAPAETASDRCLVAFPVDHALDEGNLNLLAEVLRRAPGALLLLTKADLLDEADRSRVAAFLRDELSGRLRAKVSMRFFSTREGYGSLQRDLLGHVAEAVVGRHAQAAEDLDLEVAALLGGVEEVLRLASAAARTEEVNRMDLRRRVQLERIRMATLARDLRDRAAEIKARAGVAAAAQFRPQGGPIIQRLQGLPGGGGAEALRRQVAVALERELEALSAGGPAAFAPFLVAARTLMEQSVRTFKERLTALFDASLDIPFQGTRFKAAPVPPVLPVVEAEPGKGRILEGLLPLGALSERLVQGRIPEEVARGLARLADGWSAALAATIDVHADEAIAFMTEELRTLEELLASAPAREADLDEALRALGAVESW
jgi:hypothetical protein